MCSEMKWGWGGRDGDGVFFDYWEREVGEEVDMREGRRGEELQGAVIPILHRFSLSVFTFFLLVYLLLFLFHSYTYTPRFIYRSLYKPPVNWCLMFWFFSLRFHLLHLEWFLSCCLRPLLRLQILSIGCEGIRHSWDVVLCESKNETNIPATIILPF